MAGSEGWAPDVASNHDDREPDGDDLREGCGLPARSVLGYDDGRAEVDDGDAHESEFRGMRSRGHELEQVRGDGRTARGGRSVRGVPMAHDASVGYGFGVYHGWNTLTF